jgi:hypothetical protein
VKHRKGDQPIQTGRQLVEKIVIEKYVLLWCWWTGISACSTSAETRDTQADSGSITATIREPLVILDGELKVGSANPTFYCTFQTTAGNRSDLILLAFEDVSGRRTEEEKG